jgi:hypothetical protein
VWTFLSRNFLLCRHSNYIVRFLLQYIDSIDSEALFFYALKGMFIDACDALGKITKVLKLLFYSGFVGFLNVRKVKVSNFIPYFLFVSILSLSNVYVSILIGSI